MSSYNEDNSAPTSSLPTFLESDPYPSASRDGTRPTSAVSAATTDPESEYGGASEDFKSAKERQSNLTAMTGLTGPVGEPGLPPSRPTTASTSGQTTTTRGGKRSSFQPPASRRGLMYAASRGAASSDAGSRPTSPVGKTHVPGVAQQAFFKPLSGSLLQAQRNQRPASGRGQKVENAGVADEVERARRYSNASLNTLRDASRPTDRDDVPPLPVSRGTQFTSDHADTAGSVTSSTPLNGRSNVPPKLDVGGLRSSNTPSVEKAPKSPSRSLRASLGIGSRTSKQSLGDKRPSPSHAHEKLSSNPSSPQDQADEEKLPLPSGGTSKPPQNTGKNYEYSASNTLFFLSGRLLNTRARPLNVLTFVLTVLPAALFFAFSAPWLWHNISPAIPIIFAYIFYITLSSFLHAALSDPGILPRNLHPHPPNPDEDRDPLTVGPATTEWVMVKTFPATTTHRIPLPNRGNGSVEAGTPQGSTAMEVPTKYCKSCSIWRPPRAHHCRICDACIETQDHHCVWLNNCVGRRNYRFFFSYVAFATLLALMLLAFTLVQVGYYAKHHQISFQQSLSGRTQERMAFALFIYSVLALPYPGSLFTYHLFLVARGETTREYLNSHKFPKKDRHRPFAQGSFFRSWAAVLVRPRSSTYMQFKHRYEPGDTRLGHTVRKKERRKNLKNRYSVQGPSGGNGKAGANANGSANTGEGVEMKQLPSIPPQAAQRGQQQPRARAEGVGAGGLGTVDRTPR